MITSEFSDVLKQYDEVQAAFSAALHEIHGLSDQDLRVELRRGLGKAMDRFTAAAQLDGIQRVRERVGVAKAFEAADAHQ